MVHSRLASFDFPGPLDGPHAIPSAKGSAVLLTPHFTIFIAICPVWRVGVRRRLFTSP